MSDTPEREEGSPRVARARARSAIPPTRHCDYCTALVYRWRGKAYSTREAAEAARDKEV